MYALDLANSKWLHVPTFGDVPVARQGHAACVATVAGAPPPGTASGAWGAVLQAVGGAEAAVMFVYGGSDAQGRPCPKLHALVVGRRQWITVDTQGSVPPMPRCGHSLSLAGRCLGLVLSVCVAAAGRGLAGGGYGRSWRVCVGGSDVLERPYPPPPLPCSPSTV